MESGSYVASCPRPAAGRKGWGRVLLAAVIVVVIVLIAIASPRVQNYEQFLSGFWSGDPTFLQEAGLSELYLYIAPCERAGGRWCRQGYLVMVDTTGGFVSNQGVEICYSALPGRWGSALKSHFSAGGQAKYKIKNAELVFDDRAVMPEDLSLDLNVTEGTLSLYDDTKLYAFLVKDNETSLAANAMYSRPE